MNMNNGRGCSWLAELAGRPVRPIVSLPSKHLIYDAFSEVLLLSITPRAVTKAPLCSSVQVFLLFLTLGAASCERWCFLLSLTPLKEQPDGV